MLFHTSSVDTHDIAYASDLGTIFDSLTVENAVNEFVTFAGFVTQCVM